jgi:predicted nucleic acid-binding protein
VDVILNAVCARAEQWHLSHEWQPILPDPDDEPLVQLAVESGAVLIVTHNIRDLQPAAALGVDVLKPRDFLAKLG